MAVMPYLLRKTVAFCHGFSYSGYSIVLRGLCSAGGEET